MAREIGERANTMEGMNVGHLSGRSLFLKIMAMSKEPYLLAGQWPDQFDWKWPGDS